jgi:hypothetical protein
MKMKVIFMSTMTLVVAWIWLKFGGVEGKFYFFGEENVDDNVEINDVECDGGDLRNETGIKHVYHDDI